MKICKICNIEKDLSEFNKREKDKYRNECKECKKNYAKEYRKGNLNNPYVMDKKSKICNTCGLEKPSEDFIKQKKICKVCRSDYMREYYISNKDNQSKKSRERYIEKSEEIKMKTGEYSRNNRDKVNKRRQIYRKDVLSKDPLYLLRISIGSSIRRSLKLKDIPKRFKTGEIIGCSYLELKSHIESLFLDGMSWDNKNNWHIDHIIPLSIAKTEEEIIILNHYSNLRPLWSRDNIVKSDNIEDTNHPIYLKIMEERKKS